jgi:hypothetical protein
MRCAVPGTRNGTLYVCSMKIGSFAAGAGLDADQAGEKIVAAALESGLGSKEIGSTYASGFRIGQSHPRSVPSEQDDIGARSATPPTTWGVKTRLLVEVDPEDVTYLWTDRLPRGMCTGLVGDPGTCKSYLTQAIAARVTRGRSLPGDPSGTGEPASVLYFNAEDHAARTIRVRADHLDTDPKRLVLLEAFTKQDKRVAFSDEHLPALRRLIRHHGVVLLVIDPVNAFFPASVDLFRDNEVREALAGLLDLVEETDVALWLVTHMRKADAEKVIYRVSGSIGLAAVMRSVLLAGFDEDTKRRLLFHVKNNLGPLRDPIEYTVDDAGLSFREVDPTAKVSSVLSAPSSAHRRWQADRCRDLFTAMFYDRQGRRGADVLAVAKRLEISSGTVYMIKNELGFETIRADKGGGEAFWMPPSEWKP